MERVAGIEPAPSAWKAEVLPLNYTRRKIRSISKVWRQVSINDPSMLVGYHSSRFRLLVEGVGFEPTKAKPSDLQSDPFDRSGTPPSENTRFCPRRLSTFNVRVRYPCKCQALYA